MEIKGDETRRKYNKIEEVNLGFVDLCGQIAWIDDEKKRRHMATDINED